MIGLVDSVSTRNLHFRDFLPRTVYPLSTVSTCRLRAKPNGSSLCSAIHGDKKYPTEVWNDRRFRIRHALNQCALPLAQPTLEPSLPENLPCLARSAA